MYALYAEDTSTGQFIKITDLRSTRFSRAFRQAKREPGMAGCRMFVAPSYHLPEDPKSDRAYLDTPAKPAPVGSPANQALQRTTLRRQKPSARSGARPVQWED